MDDTERRKAKRSRFDQKEPEPKRASRFDRRSRSPPAMNSEDMRSGSPLERVQIALPQTLRRKMSTRLRLLVSSRRISLIDLLIDVYIAAAAARIGAQIQAKKGIQHVDVPPIRSTISPSGGPSASPGAGNSASTVNGEMYIADGDYIRDIEVNDLRNRYTLTKGSTQKTVNTPCVTSPLIDQAPRHA